MSLLRVAPIVEGHGEVEAVRTLLDRIWRELLGGEYVETLRPVRQPRSKLLRPQGEIPRTLPHQPELERAIRLAGAKLADRAGTNLPALILVLLDAETDCPGELGPDLLEAARSAAGPQDVTCVLANVMYESWFVAAAQSLTDYLSLSSDEAAPANPEDSRAGKSWIERHFRGPKYSETVDQPSMTARMDLSLCRQHSPSFDKLCRELEKRLRSAAPSDSSASSM